VLKLSSEAKKNLQFTLKNI